MHQEIVLFSVVVKDYDEALQFFIDILGFELVEDRYVPEQEKRWVVIKPRNSTGAGIVLARASTDEQRERIGSQTGGRVGMFLGTDDFWRDYKIYSDKGVEFVREPQEFEYGTVAVFKDLYGNLWDLVQYSAD